MQKIKSLAAVFLALFILAAIPTQALAAEAHVDAITAHTHQWYFDHYDTTYIPIDDETHLKTLYPVYKCSVSGCSAFDIRDGYEYIRYERHCVQCGHSTGYWDHYSCPGNGHCILPQSVFPVLTDK